MRSDLNKYKQLCSLTLRQAINNTPYRSILCYLYVITIHTYIHTYRLKYYELPCRGSKISSQEKKAPTPTVATSANQQAPPLGRNAYSTEIWVHISTCYWYMVDICQVCNWSNSAAYHFVNLRRNDRVPTDQYRYQYLNECEELYGNTDSSNVLLITGFIDLGDCTPPAAYCLKEKSERA